MPTDTKILFEDVSLELVMDDKVANKVNMVIEIALDKYPKIHLLFYKHTLEFKIPHLWTKEVKETFARQLGKYIDLLYPPIEGVKNFSERALEICKTHSICSFKHISKLPLIDEKELDDVREESMNDSQFFLMRLKALKSAYYEAIDTIDTKLGYICCDYKINGIRYYTKLSPIMVRTSEEVLKYQIEIYKSRWEYADNTPIIQESLTTEHWARSSKVRNAILKRLDLSKLKINKICGGYSSSRA